MMTNYKKRWLRWKLQESKGGSFMSGFTFDIFSMQVLGNARELVPLKILELMETNKDIVYVFSDAASEANTVGKILSKYPDRAIDVGIAESNLVGVAAGTALAGKKAFATAFGPFLSLRATDQVCLDVAYNDVPVCVIGTHGGLTSGGGPTHYTIMDYAIMRAMPNMIMVAPADANQSVRAVEEFLKGSKPVYMRLPRGDEALVYSDQSYSFEFGKAVVTKEGKDAVIIAAGSIVYHALKAAQEMEKEGIDVRVLDMHTIKPLDTEAVLKAAKDTGVIVTVEDHNIVGGLGSAVAETLSEAGVPCKFKRLGVPDVFAKLGYPATLYPYYGYDSVGISNQIKSMLGKK
jgi:transketolase